MADALDKLDERSRKSGQKEIIDAIADARKELNDRIFVPNPIANQGFERRLKRSQTSMASAYATAIKKLIASKLDNDADRIQADFDAFLESFDSVTAGTVWGGTMEQQMFKDRDTYKFGFELTVAERKGNAFSGTLAADNGVSKDVSGTIEFGTMNFVNESGHKYVGVIVGDTIAFQFQGFSQKFNKPTRGAGTVTLIK
jgi:hypothetical protein